MAASRRNRYKAFIDALVADTLRGQGQIASSRALAGIWNAAASATEIPEQHEYNLLLARLSVDERTVLARMLREEFITGVHQTLVALADAEFEPFDAAFEGGPHLDYMGRLDGWEWPSETSG